MKKDPEENEGQRAFREAGEKLKSETQESKAVEAKGMKQALVTLDSLKSKANVGMNNIGTEDIMPPQMFLVQGIKDKSELVDEKGNQCPDGKLYLKGLNQILDSVEGYFVWVKRGEYTKEGNSWDGSKMYKTIFVRASDMLALSVTFNKSNTNSLSDLFTAKVSQKLPLFVFRTEIKVTLAKNKAGIQFFKMIVNVKGVEEDPYQLTMLSEIAERFNNQVDLDEDIKTIHAADEAFSQRNADAQSTDQVESSQTESNGQETDWTGVSDSDDIPF